MSARTLRLGAPLYASPAITRLIRSLITVDAVFGSVESNRPMISTLVFGTRSTPKALMTRPFFVPATGVVAVSLVAPYSAARVSTFDRQESMPMNRFRRPPPVRLPPRWSVPMRRFPPPPPGGFAARAEAGEPDPAGPPGLVGSQEPHRQPAHH